MSTFSLSNQPFHNQPIFTRHSDGRVTVDRWTERLVVDKKVLADVDEAFVAREGRLLQVRCFNGEAQYRIEFESMDAFEARLASFTHWNPDLLIINPWSPASTPSVAAP